MFHAGNPDAALWEFKHGNGCFRRGDLLGLRDIKRRASRHALAPREFPQKPPPPPPNMPPEAMHPMHETQDHRMPPLNHAVFDLSSQVEASNYRQQVMADSITKVLAITQDLARAVSTLVPSDHPVRHEGTF